MHDEMGATATHLPEAVGRAHCTRDRRLSRHVMDLDEGEIEPTECARREQVRQHREFTTFDVELHHNARARAAAAAAAAAVAAAGSAGSAGSVGSAGSLDGW